MQASRVISALFLMGVIAVSCSAANYPARRDALVADCVMYGDKALAAASQGTTPGVSAACFDGEKRPNLAETGIGFAAACFEAGRDIPMGQQALSLVLSKQDLGPKSLTHGCFPWYDEKNCQPTLDATYYIAPLLAYIAAARADAVPADMRGRIQAALQATLKAVRAELPEPSDDDRKLLRAASMASVGHALGDAGAVNKAVAAVQAWSQAIKRRGLSDGHSPTFDAVRIGALQWVWWGADETGKKTVSQALDLAYRDFAQRVFANSAAMAGAMQRAYRVDYLRGGGVSRYLIDAGLEGPQSTDVEPFAMFLIAPGYVPTEEVAALAKPTDAARTIITCGGAVERTETYMTPSFSLGTCSGEVGPTTIPIFATYATPGGALTSYFYVVGAPARVASVQHGNVALVSFDFDGMGTPDRRIAYIDGVIGERRNIQEVYFAGGTWANDLPSAINEYSPIAIKTNQGYVGLILLPTGPAGQRGETTRPKPGVIQWYGKGDRAQLIVRTYARQADYVLLKPENNVRAGLVIEIAAAGDYPDLASFVAHLRKARVKETVNPSVTRRKEKEETIPMLDDKTPKSRLEFHFDYYIHHALEYTGEKTTLKLAEEMNVGRVESRMVDGKSVWDDSLWDSPGLKLPVPGFVAPPEPVQPAPKPAGGKPAKPK
jgi:hypothetical protein